MDAFKGVFRRANQSVKEKTGRAEATHDGPLEEAVKRVRLMERQGHAMMDKVARLSKAFEEIGGLCGAIAEDYKQTVAEGFTSQEMASLAQELAAYGAEVVGKAQELQRNLRENAYDNIGAFAREVPSIKNMEEDRKKKQLEYDFFREKVATLIKDPPKDSTRIPRNEGIRENWRQQLWQSTESMKAAVSNMISNGQRSLDAALYTVSMSLGNYHGYAGNSAKNHFVNARLPAYNSAPLLAPAQLPPPPPPYQPPQQQPAYGGQQPGQYGQAPGQQQPPQQQQYGSPQHGQYQQQQQQYGSPQHGQYTSPGPQFNSPQQGQQQPPQQQQYQQPPQQQQQNWQQQQPNSNPSFGGQQQQQQQQQQSAAPWQSSTPPAQPQQDSAPWASQPPQQQQQQQPQQQQPQQQAAPWASQPSESQPQQQQQPQQQAPWAT